MRILLHAQVSQSVLLQRAQQATSRQGPNGSQMMNSGQPKMQRGGATQVGSYGLLVDEYEVHTNFDGRDGDDEIQVSATVLPLPPFLCTLLFVYFLHVEWNQQPGSSFNASSGFELSLFTPSKQVSAHLSRIQFVQEAIQGLTETLHLFTASRPRRWPVV